MGRSTQAIGRSLARYGDRATAVAREASNRVGALRERAGQTRARGIAERGRQFGSMVSGVGNMIGNELAMAPVRKREAEQHAMSQDRHQLGMMASRGQLVAQERARQGGMAEAQKLRTLHSIMADTSSDVPAYQRLADAGFMDEAKELVEYENSLLELKGKEKSESEANRVLLGDIFEKAMVAVENGDAGALEQIHIVNGEFLRENVGGFDEAFFTGEIEPGDVEFFKNLYGAHVSIERDLERKKELADLKDQDVQTTADQNKAAWDEVDAAMKQLGAVGDNGLGDATARRINSVSPKAHDILVDMLGEIGTSTKDRRAAINRYNKVEPEQRTGWLGKLDQYKAENPGATINQFMEYEESLGNKPDEPDDERQRLSPPQAQARLRDFRSQAKIQWEGGEHGDLTMEKVFEKLVADAGENLEQLNSLASGKIPDPPPAPKTYPVGQVRYDAAGKPYMWNGEKPVTFDPEAEPSQRIPMHRSN